MRREALAKARRDRGYSQEALANEIGVASGTLAKWEQGLTRPQARQPPALACALGTTLEGATAP
jgi:transcriptional regulator with XRE-family HTH domain